MTTGRRIMSARLLASAADLPRQEAMRLLETATGQSRALLIREAGVAAEAAGTFADLVERRRAGEPLQYIEGATPFGPVDLAVDRRVLIPRPETEQLWETVVELLKSQPPRVIIDLGTGSGNLAIALKHTFPAASVHAVDVSRNALDVAAANATASGLDVQFYQGDLFAPLPKELRGTADLVISNPPYVAFSEIEQVAPDVREYEPPLALFGGEDGLSVLRRIIAAAPVWLAPGGLLACEIGASQGSGVAELSAALHPRIMKDLSGRDRFLIAQKGEK